MEALPLINVMFDYCLILLENKEYLFSFIQIQLIQGQNSNSILTIYFFCFNLMNNSHLTPDRSDITGIKISKFEKVQKTTTQSRVLQTDRKKNESIKSPLMLIVLLRKKHRQRIQHAFVRLNMYKNKANNHKIIAKYISSILKFKIKLNEAHTLQKLKSNRKNNKNLLAITTAFTSWIYNKFRNRKSVAFMTLKYFSKPIQPANKQDIRKAQLPPRSNLRDSKVASTTKKQQPNRSLDLGNKSISASRLNLSKRLDFDRQDDLPADIQKIRRQNEELKLMQLSQEARQALKKVQRFDRIMYAQQTEKVCKQVLLNELKRLQKIKNSQNQMRLQFYDNQLTVTALYNHIRLISELNRDLGDITKLKQTYQKQESKRKQEQFKANLQNKRSKSKPVNVQAQIKQLIQNIDSNLQKKDYQKARQDISIIITKYQKEQLLKERVIVYKALLESLNNGKEMERSIQDILKLSQNFKNIDLSQTEASIRSMKTLQKQFNLIISKYSKQQQKERSLNIIKNLQLTNSIFIQVLESQKTPIKSNVVQKNEQNNKKIDPIQLDQMRKQIELINKSKTQFQLKITQLVQKSKNKLDIKRDLQNLKKDKLFQQKPYPLFFYLEEIYLNNLQENINVQTTTIINFIISLTQVFSKDKVRYEAKSKEVTTTIQNLVKKYPKLSDLSKNIQNLLSSVSKNTENMLEQQRSTRNKGQQSNQKTKSIQKPGREPTSNQKRPPIQPNKSVDSLGKSESKNLIEIKTYKQKIATLQKQLQSLKGQKGDKKKLQQQIKQLQDQLKAYKQRDSKEKIDKNKQTVTQVQKSITTITTIFQSRNLKQLQLQTNKFLKANEKDEKFSHIAALISQLVKSFIEKQTQQPTRKKQMQSLIQTVQRDKQKIEVLTKITKQSEAEIKNGIHLSNPDYWDKYTSGIDLKSNIVLRDLIKIFKILTLQIKNKSQKSEGTASKVITETISINKILQIVRYIGEQVNKKQFLKGDEGWIIIQQNLQKQDKIGKALIKIMKRTSEISRTKISEQRKANQKSMKSYQNQLEKLNKIINQSQIKIREKQSQLQKTLSQMQKNAGEDRKRSSSLRSSRKSARSSEKEEQLKNIKASIQALAGQEKNMLQRLNMAENQKIALVQSLNAVENDLKVSFKTIEEQRITIKNLQKNISDEHSNYQKQFEDWKAKSLIHGKQVDQLRNRFKIQLTQKQQKVVEQYENILKQRQQALQNYHRDFTNIQNQLNNQIEYLKQQLRIKNEQSNGVEQYQILRKRYIQLEQKYSQLKFRLGEPDTLSPQKQTASTYTQKILKQNQKLQIEINNHKNRHKQLQKQIFNLNLLLERSKAEQNVLQQKLSGLEEELKTNRSSFQELQNSPRIIELEQQTTALKRMIDSLETQLKRAKQIFANEHVKKLEDKIAHFDGQNRRLQDHNTHLREQLQNMKIEFENIKIDLISLQTQQKNRDSQFENMHKLRQMKEKQLQNVRNSQKQLEQELKAYQRTIRALQNEISQTKNTNQVLKQEIRREKSVKITQRQELQKQANKFRQQYTILQTQLNNLRGNTQKWVPLQEENKRLVQSLAYLQGELKTAINKISSLQSQLQKTHENISYLSQQNKNIKISHESIEKQLIIYRKGTTQKAGNAQLIKIKHLQQQINRIRGEQEHIINQQIKIALKNQEEDFNRFLVNHQRQIQNHFFTLVIPERVTVAIQQYKANNTNNIQQVPNTETQTSLQISNLKQNNIRIQTQLDEQLRRFRQLDTQYQNNIRRTQEIEKNLNDVKRLNVELERTKNNSNQDRELNAQINRLKTQNTKLQIQYDNQVKISSQNDNRYKTQLKNTQDLQRKLNEDIRVLRSTINELQNKLRSSASTEERVRKYLQYLQISWEEASLGYVNERVTKLYLKPVKVQPQTVVKQVVKQVIKQVIKPDPNQQRVINELRHEINILVGKNTELENRVSERERLLRSTEDKLRKQLSDQIKKYEQRIVSYQKRISQSASINSSRTYQIGSLNNHTDCQRKYRELESKYNKQVGQLKIKISQNQTGSNELQLLRQVISNQKIELKHLQMMVDSFKQSKQQANKQKQMYFNQLKMLSSSKDQQISRIRTQYESKLANLTIERNNIQITDKSNYKVIQQQSIINSKILQIKHLNDVIERRKRQIQEQHDKLILCERQRQNLRMNCNSMESHIMRLQTDISYLNNQLERHKILVHQLQNREMVLRNDLMRVKSQTSDPEDSNKNLKQQINTLKNEIIRITSTNIQQMNTISHENTYDSGKIKKMIHDIEAQRNTQRYGYEEAQLQILHKINQEVTDLVAVNRQLQTKCVLLESHIEGGGKFLQDVDVFLLLQEKIEGLINFLIQKNLLDNTDNYSKFMHNSKQCLSLHDVEGYFNNWLNFMKSLFLLTNDLKSEQLRQKAEQMIELKQQMNQILDKHIEFAEDENYETLDKYKMIFSDIRILLKQYMNSRNEEYIQMIWRSLDTGDNEQANI